MKNAAVVVREAAFANDDHCTLGHVIVVTERRRRPTAEG
jgi:hypothetical protein